MVWPAGGLVGGEVDVRSGQVSGEREREREREREQGMVLLFFPVSLWTSSLWSMYTSLFSILWCFSVFRIICANR